MCLVYPKLFFSFSFFPPVIFDIFSCFVLFSYKLVACISRRKKFIWLTGLTKEHNKRINSPT